MMTHSFKCWTLLILTFVTFLCSGKTAMAQEAYAVYTDDGTLTFYYDNEKSSRSGTKYSLNTGSNNPGWFTDHRQEIKKAVFDPSFSGARPTSTHHWFAVDYNNEKSILSEIVDIEYLNTSEVTNMRSMFFGCSGLTKLDVTHFDTSKVTDMVYMFAICSSLTNLDVSHFDTSKVTDIGRMFYGCSSLTNLDVTHFDTSKVRNMDYMFAECRGLTNLDVTHFDTSKVTNMSCMFRNCNSLMNIDVSHFDTSNVKKMGDRGYGGMFSGCSSLKNLDLSHFNTSNVTDMSRMFYGCSGLTNLDVSHFNTSNVTDMSSMFGTCDGLTSLDVSHFDTSKVTDMGSMFGACVSLTSLDLSHFDTSKVTNMGGMFFACRGLTSLDLSHFDTSNVTTMDISWGEDGMFLGCTNLSTIYVGESWNIDKMTSSDNMFLNCYKLVGGMGTKYDANHVDKEYAHIDGGPSNPGYLTDKNAFPQTTEAYAVYTDDGTLTFYCDNQKSSRSGTKYSLNTGANMPGWYADHRTDIKKAVFDSSFDGARPTSTYKWFAVVGSSEKSILTEIVGIEHLNTSAVTNMGDMFWGCGGLTSLDLSHFDTSMVTNMGDMFHDCSGLTSLDVSHFDTSNVTNMSWIFGRCSGLKNLDLSHFDTSSVTNMDWMFYGCSGLTSLDLSHFDTSNVTDMSSTFSGCSGLTNLDLSHFDTSKVKYMDYMFIRCDGLTSLDVSHFDTRKVKYMDGMFQECSGLTSLDLSNFDTNEMTELYSMFGDCTNLSTIYVGESWNTDKVTSSGNMFLNCTKLVGGMGTKYDANHVDKEYAHIDGGPSNPGYLTDKNTPAPVSNSDDLQDFINGLGDNMGTEEEPVSVPVDENGLMVDNDVTVDDLQLAIDGGESTVPVVFSGGHINITSGGGIRFGRVLFTGQNGSAGPYRTAGSDGGIRSAGLLTFSDCVLADGSYTIENQGGGRMTLKEGTAVQGQTTLVNNGTIYTDGTTQVANAVNKFGGRILVTGTLSKDIHVTIPTVEDVEQGVTIVAGSGYTLTNADIVRLSVTVPDGYEWKYDAMQNGIVVSTATAIRSIDHSPLTIGNCYDLQGCEVRGEQGKGLRLQRMSDGTVKKVMLNE